MARGIGQGSRGSMARKRAGKLKVDGKKEGVEVKVRWKRRWRGRSLTVNMRIFSSFLPLKINKSFIPRLVTTFF